MKYPLLLPALAAPLVALLFACRAEPRSTAATPTAPKPDTVRVEPVSLEGADTFAVTEGLVYWTGKKAVGDAHSGAIQVKEGELLVNQGRLLKGIVILNMASISVSSIQDGGERRDLESHLKDKDFFDVAGFPEGRFEFDEVLPSNDPVFNWVLSGQLTLKGKTNPINIPVKMTVSAGDLSAESPTFVINRTQWGINFRSGALGTTKDKLIEDMVPLSLKIKAKKGR